MRIITDNIEISNKKETITWFHFHLKSNDSSEFLTESLPYPSYIKHINLGYFIAWAVDGYFGTKKGQNYYTDTVAKFLITFKESKPETLDFKPKNINFPKVYKLNQLSKNLRVNIKNRELIAGRAEKFADFTFWAIKLHLEDLIKDFEGFVAYSVLENWALTNLEHKKGMSTIKAKCKSIWNYYYQRDFKLLNYQKKDQEEVYMTRNENIKKIHQKRVLATEKKILAAISFYKDLDEKITIKKICDFTQLHRNTVSNHKHLFKD